MKHIKLNFYKVKEIDMRIEEILRKLRTNEHTLFERIELLNIENGSKKRAQLFIKPKIDGLVYTNKKNGLNIVGFVDNETELLVVDKTVRTGRQITTPHQRYHELAVEYAINLFHKLGHKLMSGSISMFLIFIRTYIKNLKNYLLVKYLYITNILDIKMMKVM